jgi:hypothetical protein
MTSDDLDYQIAEIFKDHYKRYLVGEIGDIEMLTRSDLLTWSLALDELAADFKAIASAVEVEVLVH